MNHLLDCDRLHNRYFAMRHGHSLANRACIIVSHPENGLDDYGLSDQGRNQVIAAMRGETRLDSDTIVVSSDFRRTRESAEIVHALLRSELTVSYEARLRERHFGELELGPDSGYGEIWRADEMDPDSCSHAAEAANQVMSRVSALVLDYENRYRSATILLVSHGDALQILQSAFNKQDAARHRQLRHLETAEIRQLQLATA